MSALINKESEFEKQGVTFKIITADMYEAVKDFYWEHYVPAEPISRSLNLTRSKMVDKVMLDDVFPHNCSIAAVNEAGDILAIRLGQIRTQDQWMEKMVDKVFKKIDSSPRLASWFMGDDLGRNANVSRKLFNILGYDIWKVMRDLQCNKMYEDKAVCSARFHGIKGLGTEIVKRSEDLAVEMGCTHTYAIVTGIHSLKIFQKLNYNTLVCVNYADFKDENGELYLKDTGEHISVTSCFKKLVQ